MENAHEVMIEKLDFNMEDIERCKSKGLPISDYRYMNFGIIVYAYGLNVINGDEYHELCVKYFQCE